MNKLFKIYFKKNIELKMLSREFQSKISEIFTSLAEAERDVEITRQVLTENNEYDPYQIFCFLDSDKKNYIEELDIINYLQSKNIFVTEIETKLLILYYDQDLDTNLKFNEFINLIESKSSQKKETNDATGPLCFTIDYALTKLLEKEIIHARKVINLLEDLRGFSEFEIHNIFHFIKNNNNNYIIQQNITNFLNKTHASFIDQDIDLIFKRIDFNKDNAIDLCEFHIFFGFPYCGYSCPFEKCENCGIECCQTCRINGPCYVHKFVNKRDITYMQKRAYRTYYTDFQNKNNDNKIINNEMPLNENNQFNNDIQKISQNLTLKLCPKRQYGPIEVCFNSNIYNDGNNFDMNFVNNTINNNNNNIYNDENNDYKTINKNNTNINQNLNYNNTLEQNFITNNNKNNNLTNEFKKSRNNNQKYYNYPDNYNNNVNNKNNDNNDKNNDSYVNQFDTNDNIINSYENYKNIQNESLNKNKENKSQYGESEFINYLKIAMLHESKVEKLKIDLSLRIDFNWEEVFRIFEIEGRGFLSKEDLIIGFNKFGIYPKDLDISLLLKRYDLKKEGYISYPNFFELIVPFSKYHRIMVDKRIIKDENLSVNPNDFSEGTLNCIRNLFVTIFNGEFILNKIKENFASLKIKFSDIFNLLDPFGDGYIGEKELAIFMQKNEMFNNSNDCDLLFLRLNKLRNGKIEFQEMCEEIEPLYEE